MSSRRLAARGWIAVIAALALAPAALAKPNVVLVVTDDQRWDTLGYMPTVRQELVGKGVHFRNAFAVNPLCCPSRTTILTGEYSHTTGVWGNSAAIGGHGGFAAFDDRETLPVWLSQLGYRTGLVGKYLNGYKPGYTPPGWDYFATVGDPSAYFGFTFRGQWYEQDYQTDVLAADALEFIRASDQRPFFLYFAPKAPHINNYADSWYDVDVAPRHAGVYAGRPGPPGAVNELDVSDKPSYVQRQTERDPVDLDRLRQGQREALLAVDDAIAAILAALAETGRLANTMFVFTSDNGYSWGEHRWIQKTAPYEESIRVPLVIRYDPGGRSGSDWRLVANIDLAETIMAAAGRSVHTAGQDLYSKARWRSRLLIEHADRPRVVPSYCGFRKQNWKYVQYGTGEEELYRLRNDRFERWNRAALYPKLVQRFRALVLQSACRPPRFVPLRAQGRT